MKKSLSLLLFLPLLICGCSKSDEPDNINKINGHEYVDLGLPSGTKWATCNVGAATPEEFGNHYCWGILEPVDDEGICGDPYIDEELLAMDNISGTSRDIARMEWGGTWRMPTNEDMRELIDNCKWNYLPSNGNVGYKVIGPNGNSIYFVAGGTRYDNEKQEWYYPGKVGYYWTSNRQLDSGNARGLSFTDKTKGISGWNLTNGFSIRPVSK